MMNFPKIKDYLSSIDLSTADPLDKKAHEILYDKNAYERASQALRRRFVRGAEKVEAIDRNKRKTQIKRERQGNGKYRYFVKGQGGEWNEPDERIWIVAMYALWQDNK